MKYNLDRLKKSLAKQDSDDTLERFASGELLDISDATEEELAAAQFNAKGKLKLDPRAEKRIKARAKANEFKVEVLNNAVAAKNAERMGHDEFARRGYEFGTIEQSWAALKNLGKSLEFGLPVHPVQALWLLNALNRTKEGDPQDLLRNLGLVARGRSKVVNKYDVSDRMQALIDGGMVKEHAALQVAEEFGCSRATALHWHRKRGELFPDN